MPLIQQGDPPAPLTGRTIAITGGAGFVGSALVTRLAPDNRVQILDLGLHGQSQPANGVKVVKEDVRDAAAMARFVADADVVIHLASIAGVGSVLDHPVATMETALLGTHNLLKAVAGSPRLQRVLIFSTSEIAGRFAYKVQEDAALSGARPGEMRWTYAVAKLAAEFIAAAYHVESNVPTVCFRPFNIYGPGQLGVGAVREFARAAVRNEALRVRGDGSQIRAWCYIDDIVDAVELACLTDAAVGKVFNVGNPRSVVTVSELAKLIVRLAGSQSPIEHVPAREVDVELRVPDISLARQVLGFEPKVELDDGLVRTLEWFRAQSGR